EDPPWKYVEAFAGGDIQTNPPATNDAVQQSGRIMSHRIEEFPMPEIMEEIDRVVDFAQMKNVLMEEGIAKFVEPQKQLLELIAKKRLEVGMR
ncbi:MAG: transaldolase family protein, partial [Planctomycetota bacterium]|nr:transaldolase family protein [Planctomycetota bacterium]